MLENTVKLHGAIHSINTKEREECLKKKYKHFFMLHVPRTSGIVDAFPVVYETNTVLEPCEDITIFGAIDSLPCEDTTKSHQFLIVKALNAYGKDKLVKDNNKVHLKGELIKKLTLQKKSGGRNVLSFMVEVKGMRNNKEYATRIPCVAWGYNAFFVDGLDLGSTVEINGRYQQREYLKKQDNKKRITYEVSVIKIDDERS